MILLNSNLFLIKMHLITKEDNFCGINHPSEDHIMKTLKLIIKIKFLLIYHCKIQNVHLI